MFVAELVERSLPIPEVCGSNPVIGKKLFILNICLLSRNDENKEKEAGNGPFKKNNFQYFESKSFPTISELLVHTIFAMK